MTTNTVAYAAKDWLIRVYTPAVLRLTPALAGHADVLEALPPLESRRTEVLCDKIVIEAVLAASLAAGTICGTAADMIRAVAAQHWPSAAAAAVADPLYIPVGLELLIRAAIRAALTVDGPDPDSRVVEERAKSIALALAPALAIWDEISEGTRR